MSHTPMSAIASTAVPTGVVVMWTTATAPTGWLLCDGSAVSRSTYSGLFAVIGTTYGSGDGSTTFNLPDLRQRFVLGTADSGTGSTLGGTGGSIDHTHTVDPPSTATSSESANMKFPSPAIENVTVAISHTHTVDIAQFTSGSNNPPFIALNFIIKT